MIKDGMSKYTPNESEVYVFSLEWYAKKERETDLKLDPHDPLVFPTYIQVANNDMPGHFPGEDHSWDLNKFRDVSVVLDFLFCQEGLTLLLTNRHFHFLRP